MGKKVIISKGISFLSLFKLFFIGLLLSIGPVIIILGIFAFFGFETIMWNRQAVTGFDGLLASIGMAPLFAAVMGVLMTCIIGLGLWIYTRFFSLRVTMKMKNNFSDF